MDSQRYRYWKSQVDGKRCGKCAALHGKIYDRKEQVEPYPPIHCNCRCSIEKTEAYVAGTATRLGHNGADFWLKTYGKLPPNYISLEEAMEAGWRNWKGNLDVVAPGKILAKGKFENRNGHLPDIPGRIWYEADINYVWNHRGSNRILFSSDGLIFVTFDHYQTYCEIV